MPDFKSIYNSRANEYEQLVACEDYEGNIFKALNEIRPFSSSRVVELGAGTGRITRLLTPLVNQIFFFDISPHMVDVALTKLTETGFQNWGTAVADNRALPVRRNTADVAIAGWTLGHFTGWYPESWRAEIGCVLAEMKRVTRPGGTIIILETLGTGRVTPRPPTADLAAYYDWLDNRLGFATKWIRTDYQFGSTAEANRLISFFFGNENVGDIIPPDSLIVPECTGIWWLTI